MCCEQQDININEQDDRFPQRTALHWAVIGGHIDVVHYLVSKGAKSNITDIKGKTAITYAIENEGKSEELLAALNLSDNSILSSAKLETCTLKP